MLTNSHLLAPRCLAVLAGMSIVVLTNPAIGASFSVVAENLNNPRGLTIGPDGSLYIAEAGIGGAGPIVPAPELNSLQTFGTSGSITRVKDGQQERVVNNLPSLGLYPVGTDVPQTVGAVFPSTGTHDIEFYKGDAYVLFGYATTTDQQDLLDSIGGRQLGGLTSYTIAEDGSFENTNFFVDLVEFEELDNPDDGVFLNNPFDLEVFGDRFYITDPGGNNFYSTDLSEDVLLEAVFPEEVVNDNVVERVPTTMAIGPDGAFYIGELTGNFAPKGNARVYRLLPGGEPEVFADDFTQIIGLDFDSLGNLLVLEFTINPGPPVPTEESGTDFTGALTQIAPDGTRKTLIGPGEGLVGPTSIVVGENDEIYISNIGTTIGTGQVIELDPTSVTSVPESSMSIPLLIVSIISGISVFRLRYS